jgi:hypothetical protein
MRKVIIALSVIIAATPASAWHMGRPRPDDSGEQRWIDGLVERSERPLSWRR